MLILIPWYATEKVFQYALQPGIFEKYHVGAPKKSGKRAPRRLIFWIITVVVLGYVAFKTAVFIQAHSSLIAAWNSGLDLFKWMFNDLANALNFFLTPLNTVIIFAQGEEVGFWRLFWSYYLLVIPLIVISNLAFSYFNTTSQLRKAVSLRDRADREVNIVGFSEKAKADEVFFGLDLKQDSKPFYAKRSWLKGHIQVIGAPGTGKTESIIQPLWFQSVRRDVPTIVLDGKASRRNIDGFYTIAASLAQGHEVIYFNPLEPKRSASYNPLRHGSLEDIKNRIIASLNFSKYETSALEKLDYYLTTVLRAIRQSQRALTLSEILKYLDSQEYVLRQSQLLAGTNVQRGLDQIVRDFEIFQFETASLRMALMQICYSEFGILFDTDEPELDLLDVYTAKKDCYFSLPISSGDSSMKFLGQLILGDIHATFNAVSMQFNAEFNKSMHQDGLVIIDETAKFVNPRFIDVLRTARNIGVSVCYTNQSLSEMENPELRLTKPFIDELSDHTNVVFCFKLSGEESIQAMVRRFGRGVLAKNASTPDSGTSPQALNEDIIQKLDEGQCIVSVRQPSVFSILKTGSFKFDKLLRYDKNEAQQTT